MQIAEKAKVNSKIINHQHVHQERESKEWQGYEPCAALEKAPV